MGLLSSIRRKASASTPEEPLANTTTRKQSVVDYEAKLSPSSDDEDISEEERTKRQNELDLLNGMNEKEKAKWVKYKEGLGQWSTKDGVAGVYGGGKCC